MTEKLNGKELNMAKKWHYYVLVLTDTGAVFVTENNWSNKTSLWERDKPPLEMPMSVAEDIAFGLSLNFYSAHCVKSFYEISNQPFRYDLGTFEWKWNEDKEGKEND